MPAPVAIVTGASTGVGRAYALALARTGTTVVAAARTLGAADGEAVGPNSLRAVVHAGAGLPGQVLAQVCDVEQEQDIVELVRRTVDELGRIDVLVNNAAMMVAQGFLDVTCDDWDRLMRTNVRAPYLTIRHVVPHMVRAGAGSIINITARGAANLPKGDPAALPGLLSYDVSKAALNRLTSFLAEELRQHGIAVNALSPGVVATRPDSGPTARPATPEAVGAPIVHLAQQTAATLTGQILHADDFAQWSGE